MTDPLQPLTLLALAPAKVGYGGYTRADRYRDFQAVFFGDARPEQKERVLFQILAESDTMGDPVGSDPYDTYRRLGRREVGINLLAILTTPPPPDDHLTPTTESTLRDESNRP